MSSAPGRDRPPLQPGQEWVWDYPRPPRLEASSRRVRVIFAGVTLADTLASQRVLETSHPPVYYLPPGDVAIEHLVHAGGSSFCEWKGIARYHTIRIGDRVMERAAWSYPQPTPAFAALRNHIAFYPGRMDGCYVDEQRVEPQPGGFYGGWITPDVVGPFKGAPGTALW